MTLKHAFLVLFACYLLLFGPALFKFWVATKVASGCYWGLFSESMKIERLFQFTLMTCYLPYTYQNRSRNEPKKFIF